MNTHTVRQNDQSEPQLCSCKPAQSKCLFICGSGLAWLCCETAQGNLETFTHHFITNSEHLHFTVAFITMKMLK